MNLEWERFKILMRVQVLTEQALDIDSAEHAAMYKRAKAENDKQTLKILDEWDKESRSIYPRMRALIKDYIFMGLNDSKEDRK